VDENLEDFSVHFSVWDWDRFSEHEFMGHVTVPLIDVLEKGTLNKWFPLLPSPTSIKIGQEGVEGKIISIIRPMIKRHSRKTSMNVLPVIKAGGGPDPAKGKNFFKAFQALPAEDATRIDKPRGSIRLYYNFSVRPRSTVILDFKIPPTMVDPPSSLSQEDRILPPEYYQGLLDLMTEKNYFMASQLGKFCNNREDAARTLIKIIEYEKKSKEFLFGVIEQEVSSTRTQLFPFTLSSMSF